MLAGYIALTLLIVALTSIVSFFLLRQYNVTANMEELQLKVEKLADMIAAPGGVTRVLSIKRLEELQELSDAQLVYIDKDMQVRQLPPSVSLGLDSEQPEFEMIDVMDTLDEQLIRDLLAGQALTDVRQLDFMNDQVVFAGAPVLDAVGDVSGAVLLYRPLRQVSNTTDQILIIMLLAAVVAVIAAIVLALIMSRRLSRPIISMTTTAKRIADGHYHERVIVTGEDEVGQLGSTLNLLSGRLSQVIQNLSDEKSKLEQMLLSLGEGIVAIDRNGYVVHRNPAALELLGMNGYQLQDEEGQLTHKQQLKDMLDESMRTKTRVQTSFKTEAGITLEAISSPTLANDGSSIGAVCLIRDVSESERLEQMRRDYIANISHELRTPLTGIRGMVEPLMDGLMETDQERDDCYLVIYQETIRLERLIGEMLDLSRLQEGRLQIELEPMQAHALLEATARRLKENADKRGVNLSVADGYEDLLVMGNEDRVIQVLIILADNALSFTPPGGQVVLHVQPDGDMVALSVADTGAGIEPADLPYIFERFYKADKSRMGTHGVGLGLPIGKLVVELMGGQLTVQTKLGEGSTFTFTLHPA